MLNREEVIQKMSERGFSTTATTRQNDKITSIHFISEPTGNLRTYTPSFGCIVHLEKEEFELMYSVPCSINILKTPSCGAFMNDEHFDRLYIKFANQVRILHKYFKGD